MKEKDYKYHKYKYIFFYDVKLKNPFLDLINGA